MGGPPREQRAMWIFLLSVFNSPIQKRKIGPLNDYYATIDRQLLPANRQHRIFHRFVRHCYSCHDRFWGIALCLSARTQTMTIPWSLHCSSLPQLNEKSERYSFPQPSNIIKNLRQDMQIKGTCLHEMLRTSLFVQSTFVLLPLRFPLLLPLAAEW